MGSDGVITRQELVAAIEKGRVQIHQDESLVSPRPPLRKEVVGSEDWLASGVPNRSTMQGWGPSGRWAHKAALSGLSVARQLVVASSRRQNWFMKIRARRGPQQIGHLSSHVGAFFFAGTPASSPVGLI